MDEWLEIQDLVDRVEELLDLGLHEDAIALLDTYESFYGDEWEIPFLYSRVYLERDDPEGSLPYLHKALRIDKKNVDVLLGLFYAYSELGSLKKSAKYLFRADRCNPGTEAVYSAMIWYYTEMNKFDTALHYFDKAVGTGTDNPDTFRNGGIAYERIGDFESAEQCFKTALLLNPGFEEVRDLLADHYIFLGETAKSVALYQEYLKDSPRNVRTLSRLVFCLSQNNQFDDAHSLAQETIRLYPNSPVGYVDLAYVHLNNGDSERALAAADKALDVSPIDAEAIRVKAIAYSDMHRDTEAKKAFEAALAAEPDNPEILRDYYHFLRDTGNVGLMEKCVQRVIKLERPYCVEDYWFLADHYREKGENLKAFGYLHRAYESMPGEKELIPPMVDIMLDMGHVSFTTPFLMRYVEKSGWNDMMARFARHRRLRHKRTQEGMRFLRFFGQQPSEFRNYIFNMYLEKFAVLSLVLLSPFLAVLFFLFTGTPGLVGFSLCAGLLACGWKTAKAVINRRLS
jgi:tetratricopeptide (TPR) repeat protein